MQLRHLRYFATVADEGSVLRAATKLRVAQPALSRQIRQLERELGIALFERARHGVQLTIAGTALRDGTRHIFERLDSATRDARLADAGTLGTLRVGVGRGAVMNPRVAAGLGAVREQYPNISITVHELAVAGQGEALRSGDVDLAIGVGSDEDKEFREEVLYTVVVDSVLVPTRLASGANGSADMTALKHERGWLVGGVVQRLPKIAEALGALGLQYDTVGSEETALALVCAGRGWVPVGHSFAETAPPDTRVLRVKGLRVEVPMALRSRATDQSRLLENVRSLMMSAGSDGASSSRMLARHDTHEAERPAMHVELRQLRALVVAIEERSLTRAARRLGLSQSAVSRQLQGLEREIGCRLLQHPIRDVTPTVAGRMFAKEATAVLGIAEGTIARTLRMARGVTGTCIIGSLATEITNGVLPTRLRALVERYPEVAVEVREMITSEQIQALLERKIDVGLIGSLHQGYDEVTLTSVVLNEDPLEGVLIAEDHPLTKLQWLRAKDLSGYPFVFMPRQRNPALYDAVMKGLTDAGVIPNSSGSYMGARVMMTAVAQSKGWTVAPRSQLTLPPRGFVGRPLEDLSVPWGLRLVWRREESDAAVQRVLDVFRSGA